MTLLSACRIGLRVMSTLIALGALGIPVMVPDAVTAKATLARSVPAADSVVDETPSMIEVGFSEGITPDATWLVVIGPDGARVDRGDTAIDLNDPDGPSATVSLRAGLSSGDYTVHWNSSSAIDDTTSFGHFGFTLTAQAATCGIASPVAAGEATPTASSCAMPPPEAPIDTPVSVGGLTVILNAGSLDAGPIDLTVQLADAAGAPVDDAQVMFRARHLEMDHGEFPKATVQDEPGRYAAEGVGMGMGGAWRVAVDIIRPGQEPVTVFFLVDLEGLA